MIGQPGPFIGLYYHVFRTPHIRDQKIKPHNRNINGPGRFPGCLSKVWMEISSMDLVKPAKKSRLKENFFHGPASWGVENKKILHFDYQGYYYRIAVQNLAEKTAQG
jgi:hypothetical protein